jgi:hypothetical protein
MNTINVNEEWRPVPGSPGYEVSDQARSNLEARGCLMLSMF